MTQLSYTVKYGTTSLNVLANTLNDVQDISIQVGRTWQIDTYSPAVCEIRSRNISAWTTAPEVGNRISVTVGASTRYAFAGEIRDVQIIYGTIPALDEAIISCEGPLAALGRSELNAVALTQTNTLSQIDAVATAANSDFYVKKISTSVGFGGKSIASSATFTGNGLDRVNLCIQTEIGFIREAWQTVSGGAVYPCALTIPRGYDQSSDFYANPFVLSDNPAATTDLKYGSVSFTSAMQTYYTQVTVNPETVAAQTTGTLPNSLVTQSVDYTTGQALNHAQYLLSQYNSKTARAYQVQLSLSQNDDDSTRRSTFQSFLSLMSSGAGQVGTLVFRGNSYIIVIEGHSIVADLSQTTLTITFSPFDNNNYLILNNAVFGTLGTSGTYPGNKLGF